MHSEKIVQVLDEKPVSPEHVRVIMDTSNYGRVVRRHRIFKTEKWEQAKRKGWVE